MSVASEYKALWMETRIEAFLRYCEAQREKYDALAEAQLQTEDEYKATKDAHAVEEGKIAFPQGEPIELTFREKDKVQQAVYDFLCRQTDFVLPSEVVEYLAPRFGDKAAQTFYLKKHIYWWYKRGHIVRGPQVLDEETGRLVHKIALKRKEQDAG
jgi:hypothetical protein